MLLDGGLTALLERLLRLLLGLEAPGRDGVLLEDFERARAPTSSRRSAPTISISRSPLASRSISAVMPKSGRAIWKRAIQPSSRKATTNPAKALATRMLRVWA